MLFLLTSLIQFCADYRHQHIAEYKNSKGTCSSSVMSQNEDAYNVAVLLSKAILARLIPYQYTPETFIKALTHSFYGPTLKDFQFHHMTEIPPSALELAKRVPIEYLYTVPMNKGDCWPGIVAHDPIAESDTNILAEDDDKLCPGVSQHYQGSKPAMLKIVQSALAAFPDLSSPLNVPYFAGYLGKTFLSPHLNRSNPRFQDNLNLYCFAALWEASLKGAVPVGFELEIKQDVVLDALDPYNGLTEYLGRLQNEDRILFPLSRWRSGALHQNHILLVKETPRQWSLIWVEPCGTSCLGYRDIDYKTDMLRIEKAVMQFFELSVPAPVKLTWKGIPTHRSVLYQRAITDLGIQGLIEYPVHLQSLKLNTDVLIYWCTAITCFISYLMLTCKIYNLEEISYAVGYSSRSDFRERLILFQQNAMAGYYEQYKFGRADWPDSRVLLN